MEVNTGSRLHFGLLHVPGTNTAARPEIAATIRSFGGAGLMIQEPALQLSAEPASRWRAEGPGSDDILGFVQKCVKAANNEALTPLAFHCHRLPPRHGGFGSGTQLGLAVASLIVRAQGNSDVPVESLASPVERGKRSWIGIHGFARGGFLVEAGKATLAGRSPLIVREPFPEHWPIVVTRPTHQLPIHGSEELQMFKELHREESALRIAEELSRLLLLGVLPALLEKDYQRFAESLFDFNRKAGERFAKVQGGLYASPRIAEFVEVLRQEQCPASGQSSWGPAVYAICRDEAHARRVVDRISRFSPYAETLITSAKNTPAWVGSARLGESID
jgi:beta-RFAP synthase